MRVLIAVGSRHGSTWAIGDELATRLSAAGHHVDIADAGLIPAIDGYDAVVVGSAVYLGRWTAESRGFIKRFQAELADVPTFVFSSGPIGGFPDDAQETPGHIAACEALLPYGDRVFAGKLDRDDLGLFEKSVFTLIKAPQGDFRDWVEIAAWGDEIAQDLHAMAEPVEA